MRGTNRERHAGEGTAHSQEAQAGSRGRKRRTVKAAVHDGDIAAPRRVEEALRESEERLRTVVTNMPIILSAIDRDGVFTLSEGKGLEAIGVRPGQVVGRSAFDLHRNTPEIIENVRRALAGEAFTTTAEWAGLTFETHYTPVRDQDGQVTGVIAVASDITERARAEDELRRLSELKSDLIALVSHELRAPLTSLSGGLELIAQDASSPAAARPAGAGGHVTGV